MDSNKNKWLTPLEISSTNVPETEQERFNKSVEFEDLPVECYCPYCKSKIVSFVKFEASWVGMVLSFFLFLILGWISFCVLPFVWPLLQDSVHSCPSCTNQVFRKRRISMPSVKNDIITLKCGSCAMVLSRKYVIMFFCMTFIIFIVYCTRWYLKNFSLADFIKGPRIDATWEDFIEKCGQKSQLGNPIHAVHQFEKNFAGKTVLWQGRVRRIQEGAWLQNLIYFDMEPSQTGESGPDLSLAFQKDLNEKISILHLQDKVEFEATLLEFRNRAQPHFGIMWDIKVIEKFDLKKELDMMSALRFSPLSLLTTFMGDFPSNGHMIVIERNFSHPQVITTYDRDQDHENVKEKLPSIEVLKT